MFNPNDIDLFFQSSIPKNKSGAIPHNWVFLDVETKEVKKNDFKELHFHMAWARSLRIDRDLKLSRNKYTYWESESDLWNYIVSLCRKKTVLYVCAHNIYFDMQASSCFYLLDSWGWTLDFCYEKGSTFILSIHRGDHKIRFISSTNYFGFALKELGKLIDLPKLEIDFDDSDPVALSAYCHRDVEILSMSILKYMRFIKDHDAGRFAVTRASQSFNWYRHSFMKKTIFIHNVEMAKDLERSAYFGSRTECFYIGKVPYNDITFLDVNSMYPSVMKANPYPVKLVEYHEDDCLSQFEKHHASMCFTAECQIETDDPAYAFRYGGKNVFPIGSFTTYLSTPGLLYALKAGHLKGISKLAIYQKDWIFEKYVDTLYRLRRQYKDQGNKIYEKTLKIMMNSLYGKFGMRINDGNWVETESKERFQTEIITDMYTQTQRTKYIMFGKELIEGEQKDGRYTFTAIAAHVTEYSRLALWDLITTLGTKRVFYTDTDSIAIRSNDCKYFDHLISDQQLGALAVDKVCSKLEIHGLKDYSVDGIRKTKGIPKRATQTGENEFTYDSFLKLRSHLLYRESKHYLLRPTTKVLSQEYTKGHVDKNGLVHPLCFQDSVLVD